MTRPGPKTCGTHRPPRHRPRGRAGLVALALAVAVPAALAGSDARAQVGILGPGLGDERPALPDFDPEAGEAPGTTLPVWPIPLPSETAPGPEAVAPGDRIEIESIEFVGNTVLDTPTLEAVVRTELGEAPTLVELRRARDAVTRLYIERGYVTSGAQIPPQSVADGQLRIEVVEGRLAAVEIRDRGGFRERYLKERLAGDPEEIVDANRLRGRLRRLQEDDRIERIDAALVPGAEAGSSRLIVSVADAAAIRAAAEFSNHQADDIREEHGRFELENGNLTGWGDRLRVTSRLGLGVRDVGLRYSRPINRFDTTVGAVGRYSASRIQDDAFRDDRITSEFWSVGFEARHPLLRAERTSVSLFALGEFRASRTELLGRPFSFVDGVENGRSRISALRIGADYARRTARDALALRATLSAGLPIIDATRNSGETPDGQFFHALFQGQWARRLDWRDATFVARADLQLAATPLLPLEQFALGGHANVRGYEENRLIRDNAFAAGAELRVPIWQTADRRGMSLGPIADFGHGWNTDRPENGASTLVSVGLQTRLQLVPGVSFELSWSRSLVDRDTVGDPSLQKRGLHFRLRAEY